MEVWQRNLFEWTGAFLTVCTSKVSKNDSTCMDEASDCSSSEGMSSFFEAIKYIMCVIADKPEITRLLTGYEKALIFHQKKMKN